MIRWIGRDSGFRTADKLTTTLALPVLAVVPSMGTPGEKGVCHRGRRILLSVLVGTVLAGGTILGWVFFG